MPYDVGERAWKIQIYDDEGVSCGLVKVGHWITFAKNGREYFKHLEDRTWRGKPKLGHMETLCKYDTDFYFVLIHRSEEFSEEDYGRLMKPNKAAQWLIEEGYNLPEELADFTNSPSPLSEAEKEVWDLLNGRMMLAKQIAKELGSTPEAIRQRIMAIRKLGRCIERRGICGYWRPDASPQETRESH